MKWEATSFTRFFVFLLIALIVAIYQIHVFKNDVYSPLFHNAAEDF